MPLPSSPLPSESQSKERIRLTISVSPEVHATFQRMADAAGTSLGRAMGDWLGDTEAAAREMATLLERARSAPKLLIQEMHSFVLGMADETGQILAEVREKSREQATSRGPLRGAAAASEPGAPRLVIRGGKSPRKGKQA